MEIQNHKVIGAELSITDKNTQVFQPGKLDTIIIHYTAGSSAKSSISSLSDPSVQASAHIVVGRDGIITQIVPFNIVAWHAGASQYGGRVGFNQFSIGIEIDNAGLLEKRGDKYYAWFGRAYEEKDVVAGIHRNEKTIRYWHAYTEKQIEVVEQLCRALIKTYNLKYILGHEEISPVRKVDPGPAFPLDKLRDKIFGGNRDADVAEKAIRKDGIVNTNLLNIRADASTQAEKVAKPLLEGQKVKILAAKDGWLRVSTEVTGWVSARYIT
jgi:N-acetylmuramoyl-L-alanine amidase